MTYLFNTEKHGFGFLGIFMERQQAMSPSTEKKELLLQCLSIF